MFSKILSNKIGSNELYNMASGKRSAIELQNIFAHNDNPIHEQHIRQFCEYVDYSVAALRAEMLEMMAAYQNPKVKVEVDEASMRTVKQKIEDMLSGILNFGKR